MNTDFRSGTPEKTPPKGPSHRVAQSSSTVQHGDSKSQLRATNVSPLQSEKKSSELPSAKGNWVSEVTHRADEFETTVRDFIQSKPVLIAACAVGVGLVGSLISGQYRNRAENKRKAS